jgi:hypothetical protein
VQRETRTIPIVFAGVSDPVATGIVARLDRPRLTAAKLLKYRDNVNWRSNGPRSLPLPKTDALWFARDPFAAASQPVGVGAF